jgi:hypothetical protein
MPRQKTAIFGPAGVYPTTLVHDGSAVNVL